MSENNYGFGHEDYALIKQESSYGVPVLPVAGDAVRITSLGIEGQENRRWRMDIRGTRSRRERVKGRRTSSWTADGYLGVAHDGVGNKPPMNQLLKNAFGKEVKTANTSVVYSLSKEDGGSFALWGVKPNFHAHAYGCITETMTITATLEDFVMLSFSGPGKDMGRTVGTSIAAAGNAVKVFTPANIDALTVGSFINIDNEDAGLRLVTAKSAAGAMTIGSVATWGANDDVTPGVFATPGFVADDVFDGTEIYVSLDDGTTEYQVSGVTITLPTGNTLHQDSSGPSPVDVLPSNVRDVTISLDAVVRESHVGYFNSMDDNDNFNVLVRFGPDVAGKRAKLALPQVNFDRPTIVTPEDGPSTVSLSGMAVASATLEDELKLTLD